MATFDSEWILTDFVQKGKWPEIHGKIGWCATEYLKGPRVLDLCCAFGLLGDRIARTVRGVEKVWGVDGSLQSIAAGKAANVQVELQHMMINEETVDKLYSLVRDNQITSIVARRAFPELFGHDPVFGKEVAFKLRYFGVKEILVEGRVVSPRSNNALKSLDDEVAMLSDSYEVVAGAFNCSYLRAKPI